MIYGERKFALSDKINNLGECREKTLINFLKGKINEANQVISLSSFHINT